MTTTRLQYGINATEHYTIYKLGSGWAVKAKDDLDNGRWYFDLREDAVDLAEYLERTHWAKLGY